MAIVKFIAIHDHNGVDRCIKYVDDREKNMLNISQIGAFQSSDITDIDNLVDYSVNPEKTRLSRLTGCTVLVSGINCSADFAKEEFKISRVTYENSVKEKHIYREKAKDENSKKKKESIEAYHVIQSFPKEVTDPELVHHIGKLYAQRMFPHQKCLVSTHMNTKHLHNHIIVCAYETERPRKFKMNKAAITKMKMINDELSLAYGLPILSNDISDRLLNRQMEDELRRFGSGPVTDINMSVGEYQARANNKAWKAGLEDTIRDIVKRSDSWEDFTRNMDTAGWTIKETPKNITFINKERPGIRVRGATLGEEFTKEAISREQKWDAVPSLEAENSVLNSKSDSAKLRQAIYDEISALSSPGPAPLHFHIPRYTKWGRRRSDLELIFIAARPSMGKTAFALNIAQYIATRLDETVAIFSLEMSKVQLVNRLIAMESHVDSQGIRTGQLNENEWESLIEGAGVIGSSKLIIDDTPSISVSELRSKCRKYKLEHDLKIILIDYLQLMTGSGRTDSRQQEISDISRALKALARELNVPVVALSQLSRAVEKRDDKRPMLSDLRESGAIEQDADVVMFLYREDYYKKDTENKNVAEVIIAKQRNGPVGTVNLTWLPQYTQFRNLSRANISDD